MPFLVSFLSGIICPAMGTFFVSKKGLLKPYSMSLSLLPALGITLGLGSAPFLVIFIITLIVSLAFEMPYFQRGENKIEVMVATLAAIIGFSVFISYLGIRIELKSLLFGDLLTANSLAFKMVLISSTALFPLITFVNVRLHDKNDLYIISC